jgi:cytochrome c-type biogenesis protein CcmH/NrfG
MFPQIVESAMPRFVRTCLETALLVSLWLSATRLVAQVADGAHDAAPSAASNPTDAASWLEEGRRRRTANDLSGAAEALTKSLALDPQSWEAVKERGDVFL